MRLANGILVVAATGVVAYVTASSPAPQQHGRKPAAEAAITLPRVVGQRDIATTACPVDHLYDKSAQAAALAKAPGVSHAVATSDFDRDGIGDLAAGTPKASDGAGSVTVVPGAPGGPAAARHITLTQDSPGVPGTSEPGDGFGTAIAWGDVNGDGYADLAVGAPGEDDTEGHRDRGAVTVLYGPRLTSGCSYTTSGINADGAGLGSALAVGDFDGDGKADVFSAGTGRGGNWDVRPTGGLPRSGRLTTASGPVAHLDATTGDFDRDGHADVALNYQDAGGIGHVMLFSGSDAGLTEAGALTVRGGRSVAAGDIDGDGYDDLVIGQPYPAESGGSAGGQITVVYGSADGLATTRTKVIHQDGVGVAGADRNGDAFGASVSVADHDADGYADVLVGAPGEDFFRDGVERTDAGQATLLRGTASGLTTTGSFTLCQDTPGILDSTESGDGFGSAVRLVDLSGHGRAGFVFGAEGEDAGDGVLLYTPAHSTGFGLAQTMALRRTDLGAPTGAHLGQTLAP